MKALTRGTVGIAWRASARIGLVLFIALRVHFVSVGAVFAPLVSVSVNDSGDTKIFRGMPLLVSITLISPTAFGTNPVPIVLASTSGPWTNSVRLDVLDASENPQSWPFNRGMTAGDTISLDNTHFAVVNQWLTPLQTMNLSTGKYSLVVMLDTTKVMLPGAWRGIVDSAPADLEVLDEPPILSEAQAANKYSQLALYELFAQNAEAALGRINQLLASYPTNFTGLRIKALTLDALGRTTEALAVCEQVIQEFYTRSPAAPEPPSHMLSLRRQLEQSLLNPPLRLTRNSDRQVALDWSGQPALNYRLETSFNLTAWSLLTTNFNIVSNRFSFTVDPVRDRQFFRLAR